MTAVAHRARTAHRMGVAVWLALAAVAAGAAAVADAGWSSALALVVAPAFVPSVGAAAARSPDRDDARPGQRLGSEPETFRAAGRLIATQRSGLIALAVLLVVAGDGWAAPALFLAAAVIEAAALVRVLRFDRRWPDTFAVEELRFWRPRYFGWLTQWGDQAPG